MPKDKDKDDDEFDFWNPKYYEHDDFMFPWRKGQSIPGVNAPPNKEIESKPKKENKGCFSILFGLFL
jgi:hypothetical protein